MRHDEDLKLIRQLHQETMLAMQRQIRDEREVLFLPIGVWKKISVCVASVVIAFILVECLRGNGIHWPVS